MQLTELPQAMASGFIHGSETLPLPIDKE